MDNNHVFNNRLRIANNILGCYGTSILEKSQQNQLEKGGAGSGRKPGGGVGTTMHEGDSVRYKEPHGTIRTGTYDSPHPTNKNFHYVKTAGTLTSVHKDAFMPTKSEESLQKGGEGGEGSKGGKVIGHTKSGKPVYQGKHQSHKDFSNNEHKEAYDLKHSIAKKHGYKAAPGGAEWSDSHKTEKAHNKKYDQLYNDAIGHYNPTTKDYGCDYKNSKE